MPGPGPDVGGGHLPHRLARGADALAEALVVPSFSRLGPLLRRRLHGWDSPARMPGAVAVVTGGTSGIGLAVALELASLGATVHLVARDPQRAARARELVHRGGGMPVLVDLVDMGDLAAVRAMARRLSAEHQEVAALVHAAGALNRTFGLGPGGLERTLASHVLGPYVLTAGLASNLMAAGGNLVMVSSGGMYLERFELGKLEMAAGDYNGRTAYARAKRAQVVMAAGWSALLAPAGVGSYSMHPGWVATPGLRSGLPGFYQAARPVLRTPAEGAGTAVWLATGGARSGAGPALLAGFFHDRLRRSEHRWPVSGPPAAEQGHELLQWCASKTGVPLPATG